MTTADYAARVYDYYRDYLALHGYAPMYSEACHWLHISSRHYYAALRWLVERRFLTHQARRWRGVRLNVRVCTCGAEITPQNAVVYRGWNGAFYVRRPCRTCFNAQSAARKRAWRAANAGYDARWMRQHRSATA